VKAERVKVEPPRLRSPSPTLGPRALKTRNLILETSKRLFMELGYGGTRIEDITDACGIARGGFHTYFPSKRDVFLALGEDTYRQMGAVIVSFERLPNPASAGDIEGWVRRYFEFMDEHGAFMLGASQAGPNDGDLREAVRHLHPRVAAQLGRMIRKRQSRATRDETALGLTVLAVLDRTWYFCRGARYPVDEAATIDTVVQVITSLVG
jgi:TetR/AcrR family transcriptional regulator